MEDKLKQLLGEISTKLEIKKDKKKSFNIFSVLGIESKELVHSKFLANLLNPEGEHCHGDFFLNSFCERFLDGMNPLENNIVWVNTELTLNDSRNEDSRVDIWIKNKAANQYIVIENKLFASDQREQLLRYHEYLIGTNKNGKRKGVLLYLTLDAKGATRFSTGGKLKKGEDYFLISYSRISDWLGNCLKSNLSPDIAESIIQYNETVGRLILKYRIIESVKEKFPNDYLEVIKQIEGKKIVVPEEDKQSKQAIKYIQDEKILNYLYSELELDFWEKLDSEISKKYEIIERKKYNYERIVRSRKKGGNKFSYGLVFKTHNQGYLRIYSYNNLLKYGFGCFENEAKGEWKWTDSERKTFSLKGMKEFSFEKIIMDKNKTIGIFDEIFQQLHLNELAIN